MTHSAGQRFLRFFLSTVVFLLAFAGINSATATRRTAAQSSAPVTTVSAASFAAPLAPDSIAAAFGAGLATRIEVATSQPLPTNIAGTTVRVNGQLASLFFVSPGQINYLIPPGAPAGLASVVVTSGSGTTSTGTVQIAPVAPALFTANGNGQGVPAAVLFRLRPDGTQIFESVACFDPVSASFRACPIDLGPDGERVFLILYSSGVRRANLTGRLTLGGSEIIPSFAGATSDFAGLDQINVEIPRTLIGRGRINLAITAPNAPTSNLVEVEIAVRPGPAPPQVSDYSPETVLAGSSLTINGSRFAPVAGDNLVRIGGVEANVISASTAQLIVRVPFGARTGPVSVSTRQGEWISPTPITLRTSVSGFIEDTRRQPLPGIVVRVLAGNITATTSAEGSFILPDVPPASAREIEIDGTQLQGTLPYPRIRLKLRVTANRDNQFSAPIALQQINGSPITVGTSTLLADNSPSTMTASTPVLAPGQTGRTGNVVFEIPPGARVLFPDGSTTNILNLTIVESSRTPVSLPPSIFSSVIVQITAIGGIIVPGGKLTFPNTDRLPAGSQATLFRFDQRPDSQTLGSFIESGSAAVSADGQRIETPMGAITETTLYFVAAPRLATTVIGRVLDSDGTTPVRQARVRARGQEAFTDGNGGFILPNVLVNRGDLLSIEASFMRPDRRVDRVQRTDLPVAESGTTAAGDLVLPAAASNRPPILLVPPSFILCVGDDRTLNFLISDPDPGQTVPDARVSGAMFVSLTKGDNGVYTLRLMPGANDVGSYTLILTATDNLGASQTYEIALRVNPTPIANSLSVTTDEDVAKAITLTSSDSSGEPPSFNIVTPPSRGRLTGAPPNLIYTPSTNLNGSDAFTFKVSNGSCESQPAVVAILVNPVNDVPVLRVPDQPQLVNIGQPISFTVVASDVDAGDVLTFSMNPVLAGATLTKVNNTGAVFTWTPSATQAGTQTINFRVTDNGIPPLSDTKPVMITVRGEGVWSQTAGPFGGRITALLADGDNLYAGTDTNVFVSINNGGNWTIVKPGLPQDARIISLASTSMSLYAGTVANGVFVSSENSARWTTINTGLPRDRNGSLLNVNALTVVGTSLYAGTAGGGVFVLAGNSQAWMPFNEGLPSATSVRTFAIIGTTLFAGTAGGVYRRASSESSWLAVSSGLRDTFVLSLAASDTELYAGTSNGVFRSTDQGQNWLDADPNGRIQRFIYGLAARNASIYAATCGGVFRSDNNGIGWQPITVGFPPNSSREFFCVSALAVKGRDLFAGTDAGVFRSIETMFLGEGWDQTNTGLTGTWITSFAVNGTTLFAGTYGSGVYASGNNGERWGEGLAVVRSSYVNTLVILGSNLFAGTQSSTLGSVGVASLSGGGFTPANSGLPPNDSVNALGTIEADLFAGFSSFIYRSSNNGMSWAEVYRGQGVFGSRVNAFGVNGTTLFAGVNGGALRSINRGQNWSSVGAGMLGSTYSFVALGASFFAGTTEGIFVTLNDGETWRAVNTGLPQATVYALLAKGTILFAGTNKGVFVSTTLGESWTPLNSGLTNTDVRALAVIGDNLFAGTNGSGVFTTVYTQR